MGSQWKLKKKMIMERVRGEKEKGEVTVKRESCRWEDIQK
jgi:hypothetical protein